MAEETDARRESRRMKSKRARKSIVVVSVIGIVLGGGSAAWLGRRPLIETWYLIGLTSLRDGEDLDGRIERLGQVGGSRTARAFAELTDPGSGSSPWTARDFPVDLEYLEPALEDVLSRSDVGGVAAVGRAFRERLVATEQVFPGSGEHLGPLIETILGPAHARPEFSEPFIRMLRAGDGLFAEVAAAVFWRAHAKDSDRAFRAVSGLRLPELRRLFPPSLALRGQGDEFDELRRVGVSNAIDEHPAGVVPVATGTARVDLPEPFAEPPVLLADRFQAGVPSATGGGRSTAGVARSSGRRGVATRRPSSVEPSCGSPVRPAPAGGRSMCPISSSRSRIRSG